MTSLERARPVAALAVLVLTILAVPLLWRPLLHRFQPMVEEQPSYLPALEASRPRNPFGPDLAADLEQYPPGLVIIGDSMAGRIDPDRLGELSHLAVSPLVQNSTGPAYWYLQFKNYVVASGTRPRWVFIFFRDTNLTDVMFRLDGPYRTELDRVAREREPELNAVVARRTRRPWQGVYDAIDRVYEARRLQAWLVPAVNEVPAWMMADNRADRILDLTNRTFALERLRPLVQADLEAADARDADFAGNVDASVLPLVLDLARAHQLHVCFVRVLRRPTEGQPPAESPALQQYVRDLRAYVEGHGGALLDDRDEPSLWAIPYADGDHIDRDARVPYTNNFWARVSRLLP